VGLLREKRELEQQRMELTDEERRVRERVALKEKDLGERERQLGKIRENFEKEKVAEEKVLIQLQREREKVD
jgi:hypothetical protein